MFSHLVNGICTIKNDKIDYVNQTVEDMVMDLDIDQSKYFTL